MSLLYNEKRIAITEVMEGLIGGVRRLPPGVFRRSQFVGRSAEDKQAIALQTPQGVRHLFQVLIGRGRESGASPVSTTGPTEIDNFDVAIAVLSATAFVARYKDLDYVSALVGNDLFDAMTALKEPNVMLQTSDGSATGIVSGCLVGVSFISPSFEDWQVKYVESQLNATLIAEINT